MTKIILFRRANGGYSAGEVAGFEDAVADRLVQAGFATHHKADATEESAPEVAVEPEPEEPEGVKAEKETARSMRPRLSTDAEPDTTYVTKDEG